MNLHACLLKKRWEALFDLDAVQNRARRSFGASVWSPVRQPQNRPAAWLTWDEPMPDQRKHSSGGASGLARQSGVASEDLKHRSLLDPGADAGREDLQEPSSCRDERPLRVIVYNWFSSVVSLVLRRKVAHIAKDGKAIPA
jgi:hypothetical protein